MARNYLVNITHVQIALENYSTIDYTLLSNIKLSSRIIMMTLCKMKSNEKINSPGLTFLSVLHKLLVIHWISLNF